MPKTPRRLSENDLIDGLRRKDQSVMEYLYDHYASALYGVLFRVIKNEDIAKEVLQDAFLKIWDKMDSYDPGKGRLFTWMLNLARNLAIDKTRSKEMSMGRKTDNLDLLVDRIDNQRQGKQHIDGIGIKEMLNRLPEDQKFVIEHLYLKGYTQSELAEEFNIPLGTVKTRTRLGLIEVRKVLKVN